MQVSQKETQRREKISNTLKQRYAGVGNVALSKTLKKQYATGLRVSWNKGLTKASSVSLRIIGEKMSKSLKAQYASGKRKPVHLIPWNKGLSKEKDTRVMASSLRMKQNNPMQYCVTQEYRNKLSKAMTGRVVSVEQRINYSLAAAERIMNGAVPHKGFQGKITLTRLGITTHFRSTWERLFLELADADTQVIAVNVEAVRILYVGVDDKIHNYIPDMLITLQNIRYLIEIKPKALIDKTAILKFKAAQSYAKQSGLVFLVITECELFSASVTTTFSEVIRKATANDFAKSQRYSLTSPVTARGEEKSLTRQTGEQE